MINERKREGILLISVIVLCGITLGHAELFSFFKIVFLLFVLLVIGMVLFVYNLTKESAKRSGLANKMIGLPLLCFILMLFTSTVKKSWDKKKALQIVTELNDYQSTNGVYPVALQAIGELDEAYVYIVDSTQTSFVLHYSVDGWHYCKYSSKTKVWIVND